MEQIIQWCNTNVGFVSGILALFSIVLSLVAIYVSIVVAKLPFKKKITVGFFTNLGLGEYAGINYYSVEATNIGNRLVKVSFVGFAYDLHIKIKMVGKNYIILHQTILKTLC